MSAFDFMKIDRICVLVESDSKQRVTPIEVCSPAKIIENRTPVHMCA